MDLDIDKMLASHGAWKRKLQAAINQQTPLDAVTIGRHDGCELGEWLHGAAKKKYGHLASYNACASAHVLFHREAGKIALMVNQRRYADAEFALHQAKPYAAVSNQLMTAIGHLWRDAAEIEEAPKAAAG